MICKRCRGGVCSERINDDETVHFECVECDGAGCDKCDDGWFQLTECARKYSANLVTPINLAAMAEHHLPQSGGLLDQSHWFVELWQQLQSEQNKIDAERFKGEL